MAGRAMQEAAFLILVGNRLRRYYRLTPTGSETLAAVASRRSRPQPS